MLWCAFLVVYKGMKSWSELGVEQRKHKHESERHKRNTFMMTKYNRPKKRHRHHQHLLHRTVNVWNIKLPIAFSDPLGVSWTASVFLA